ncbi:MAG TPA: pilus assembly protein TadG-related protein [Acidimicrobiia bacterium]|nr:pilus assembly protein TadG-related protein [Acidimicrobiia bacterium]
MRQRRSDERGVFTVLMAVSMLALLGLAGLVIDGGRAYAARRAAQNAADAAALAGTAALNEVLFSAAGQEGRVYDAVVASLAANGITEAPECRLVDQARQELGSCPPTDTGAGLPATVAGVSVRARDSQGASFMKAVGIDGFSAAASATAQIQALRAGSSPFMICGLDAGHRGFDPPLLLAEGSTWKINPDAVNQSYGLHGPQVPDCNAGSSSFKGLADGEAVVSVPGWWPGDTGVHAGPIRNVVARADACTATEGFDNWTGCTIVVPICVDGRGTGSGADLYCVRLGVFRVSQSHQNAHEAVFVGAAVVSEGQGGGKPVPNEARLIKLSR